MRAPAKTDRIAKPLPAPPTALDLAIYRELQRRRMALGKTQAEIADATGLSLKYIGEIERGAANVRLQTLTKVAAAVGWTSLTNGVDMTRIPQPVKDALISELRLMRVRLDTLETWLGAIETVAAEPRKAETPALVAQVGMTGGPRIRKRRANGHA